MRLAPKDQDRYRKLVVWKQGAAGAKFNSLLELTSKARLD
jgi:hypothetical protein